MTTLLTDEHPLMKRGLGRLEGQVAIVTGANSGIGRAIARLYAREGAKVLAVDIDGEAIEPRIDALIQADGGTATFMQGDLTKAEVNQRMLDTAVATYGKVDVFAPIAGTGVRSKAHETTDEQWHSVIDINLNGTFYGIRAVLKHMVEQRSGSIVMMASSLGTLGTEDYPAYCASKGALVNLTRQLAIDYSPLGIRINSLCPGPVETPRGMRNARQRGNFEEEMERRRQNVRGLHRIAKPEEIAYAALFLACDESSYVTGHNLVIDGGQTTDA
ncbi:MAG: 3-oxoacyl-[acyl-carrier protein] reductase [Chloroflexi bacterium]|jgi:NAD(P)-dependent dehydrogenase (short-subunit alcohol dehydrogenase family)|nr:MAG: 3-oxoacyl-[acyl-carrier protein] reductase [Chloroflexota bacterium]